MTTGGRPCRASLADRGGARLRVLPLPLRAIQRRVGKREQLVRLQEMLPKAPDGSLSGVAVSFGIACFPDDNLQPNELLALADAALYRAKRQRKDAEARAAAVR